MKPTTVAGLLTILGSMNLFGNAASAQQELFQQPQSSSLQTSSGMLLGVYANASSDGLQIVGTIPGYSAEGRLFAGDVLKQVTASNMPVFPIRSHSEIEHAKSQIGPFREAAVEFFRPGVGLMYAWVTFKPIGGGSTQPHVHSPQPIVGGPFSSGGGQPGLNPIPFNPNNTAPNAANPNNVVMKMELDNPNNLSPRRGRPGAGGQGFNPNNQVPFSSSTPFNPNNSVARSEFSPPGEASGRLQAEFRLESEKPGARLLFKQPLPNTGNTTIGPFSGRRNFSENTFTPNGGTTGGFNSGQFPTFLQQSSPQLSPLQQRVQELKRQQRSRTFGN